MKLNPRRIIMLLVVAGIIVAAFTNQAILAIGLLSFLASFNWVPGWNAWK